MKQLALPFAPAHSYAPEDFCTAPSNAMARDWLARPEAWSHGRLVMSGAPGCGKTHLLQVWAAANGAAVIEGAHLQGLVRPDGPVAIDDADIVPEPRALLHVLNAAAEDAYPVLMAARLAPARMAYKLADLTSRLRASQTVEIQAPEDELLAMLLTRLAAERQLSISLGVQNFLLINLPRTAAAMREAVARLDRATLDAKVKVTRKLAAAVLEGMKEG